MKTSIDRGTPHGCQLLAYVMAFVFLFQAMGNADERTRPRSSETSQALPLPARTGAPNSNASHNGKGVSSSSQLLSTVVSLGVIVSVLLLVGRGLKRVGFRATPTLPIEAFELLGRRSIEPRVAVHLVKCGSRVLVLGVSPEGVRTLSEINDPVEVERLTELCQSTSQNEAQSTTGGSRTAATVPPNGPLSTTVRRALVIMAALGLALFVCEPASAQTSRATSTGTRSKPASKVQQAIPDERARDVHPIAFERADPAHESPRLLGPPEQLGLSLKMLAIMSIFSLAPSLLMMTTCFVRFVVSLGLLRQALGTQQGLPNQVLTAICLFLTFLVMSPVWQRSYNDGIRPYTNPVPGEELIDEATALSRAIAPVRTFMSQQIDKANNADAVWMLLDFQRPLAETASATAWHEPQNYEEVPLAVLAPAYLLSELKVGFLIGFQLFLPFLVIDLVVAMILTSLGLTMLPPSMVSLPFKLLLFVMIDGWFLTVGMLLESVRLT